MSESLVIGIGNLDRGDDGVGRLVARQLRAEGIPAIEQSGEATQLLASLSECESALVIDAADFGAAPGEIRRFDAACDHVPVVTNGASSHGFGLAQALELARTLGALPQRCVVYAVQVESCDIGQPLSSAVAETIAPLLTQIKIELADAHINCVPQIANRQPRAAAR